MRRIKGPASVFLSVCVLILCISMPIGADSGPGSGTEQDPYLISNAEELLRLREERDAYYRLTDNIQVSTWNGQPFSGVLDGDGYKITIGKLENGFLYSNSGTVKNLSVELESDGALPAVFVRENRGTIENVHISGSVRATSGSAQVGTVAAINDADGVIRNSYSTADVSYGGSESAALRFGALVGTNNGTIEHCYWQGYTYKVKSLVGKNAGTVTGCVLGGEYGKSDQAMRDPATYQGWDFDAVWKIDADMNGGFPCLILEREFVKIPVSGVALEEDSLFLEPGQATTLRAEVSPADAWNKALVWSSSNPSAASVQDDGTVTAHQVGSAVITAAAEDGGFSDQCLVSVVVKTTSLTLDRRQATADAGEEFTLTAVVAPEDATIQTVVWQSSDERVATVQNGTVQCLAPGTATITAATADGGGRDTCTVTVLPPASQRYDVNGDGACTLEDGQLLAGYLIGQPGTGLTAETADVNGDGIVNSRDVTDLLKYLKETEEGS